MRAGRIQTVTSTRFAQRNGRGREGAFLYYHQCDGKSGLAFIQFPLEWDVRSRRSRLASAL
jgi:hypothetical protein